jgi:hypothetical protein
VALALVLSAVVFFAARTGSREPARSHTARPDAVAGAGVLGQVFHQDFRGAHFDDRAFRVVGRGDDTALVRSDQGGLRLLGPDQDGKPVGLVTLFGVHGDFEITASFEAAPTPPPDAGYGAGPELLIKPVGGWETFASMARYRRAHDSVYSLVHGTQVGEASRLVGEWPTTVATSGRFRLVRKGDMLYYLVADGPSETFREEFRTKFGAQDLELVRIAATTGGSRRPVEAIWKDLSIRAEALPGFD